MVLIPGGSGNSRLDFHFAAQSGDVWLDDVHFQPGVYSVYRRDFQNGSVLVNPGYSSLDVQLEAPFRRIQGTVDPAVNNGLYSATQTVPAQDALFLIGADRMPPATIQDLHAAPTPAPQNSSRPVPR